MARSPPDSNATPAPAQTVTVSAVHRLWGDPVLRVASLAAGLLLAYQIVVTLLQPVWIGPVTDWRLVLAAWPGLLGVVLLNLWLTRIDQPEALSWWLVSGGLRSPQSGVLTTYSVT